MLRLTALAALTLLGAPCAGPQPSLGGTPPEAAALTVSSPELAGGSFPKALTCDGAGTPPTVEWAGASPAVLAMAVELLDPDAPGGTFVHWLVYTEHVSSPLSRPFVEGLNSRGSAGYTGPCPPPGPGHHYHLLVRGLSTRLALKPGFRRNELEGPTRVLNGGELVATYARA